MIHDIAERTWDMQALWNVWGIWVRVFKLPTQHKITKDYVQHGDTGFGSANHQGGSGGILASVVHQLQVQN